MCLCITESLCVPQTIVVPINQLHFNFFFKKAREKVILDRDKAPEKKNYNELIGLGGKLPLDRRPRKGLSEEVTSELRFKL